MNWTRSLRRRRRRHPAAARDAVGPVGEAPGRVVRADDEPRPDVRVSSGERLGDDLFGERLERAVVREILEQAVVWHVAELLERIAFDHRLAAVGVGRQARDENVEADGLGELLG